MHPFLGNKFEDFYYLPTRGTRGGIILARDRLVVALSNPHYTDCTLTALARPAEEPDALWWVTGVYGPQEDHEKIMFLQELSDI